MENSNNDSPTVSPFPPENDQQDSQFLKELIKVVVIAFLIVTPFRIFVAQPFIVSGASMDPTFETGDYLIIDQLTYEFTDPHRGDVVIFQFPRDPSKFFVKRVIGLPGEVIEIEGSEVTIRSNTDSVETLILKEPYIADENKRSDSLTVVLDDEEYFVMGDNRRASSDSRSWGPVTEDLIIGKAFLRLFPVAEASILPGSIDSYE